MRKLVFSLSAVAVLVGCAKKVDDTSNAVAAMAAAAGAAGDIQKGQEEATKFYNDRKAKGDTLAMPYAALEKLLPAAPSGYKSTEDPSGSSQTMPGFSISQAKQSFVAPANADGNAPRVEVTLVDLGGTESGYSMMALPLMMGMSSEDAHHKTGTVIMATPYTWGYGEFNKDSKDTKLTVVTRYRYMITVETYSQGSDQTEMAKALAESVAKQLVDK
jgi:hypothetical protein